MRGKRDQTIKSYRLDEIKWIPHITLNSKRKYTLYTHKRVFNFVVYVGLCLTYIFGTHLKTKCILSFGVGCISNSLDSKIRDFFVTNWIALVHMTSTRA